MSGGCTLKDPHRVRLARRACDVLMACAVRLGTALLLVGMLWTLPVHAGAVAREATPTPIVPPPRACMVPPRSYEEVIALLATPVAGITPTRTPGPVPEGMPASPDVEAAIAETVQELVACYNAGEPLRVYRMYTDAFLQRLLMRQGELPRHAYDALATPQPAPPDGGTAILTISGTRLLDHGKAGALVTLQFPSIPVPKTFFFTFARQGSRWLIDDVLGEITFSVP